eukprot:gene6036-6488_t
MKFQTTFTERSIMIEKSGGGNDYVLEKFFANENCNLDGNQLFESVGMRSGDCLVSDRKTAKRRTCQSSIIHIEEFDVAGCDDERHRTVNQYVGIDQCFLPSANITNTHTLQPYQAVSYGCNNIYVPGGFWYTNEFYSDGDCQNIVGAVGVLNGYCLSPDQTISYKVEYPDESIYFKSADCTGEVQSNEIASTSNVCYARSDLKTSIKQLFIQNNQ